MVNRIASIISGSETDSAIFEKIKLKPNIMLATRAHKIPKKCLRFFKIWSLSFQNTLNFNIIYRDMYVNIGNCNFFVTFLIFFLAKWTKKVYNIISILCLHIIFFKRMCLFNGKSTFPRCNSSNERRY